MQLISIFVTWVNREGVLFLFFLFFHTSAVAAAGPLARTDLAADVDLGIEGSLRGVFMLPPGLGGGGWTGWLGQC